MGETDDGRRAYHHGDLRNALVKAATELAAEGGPGRVVLREAARRVGVSPTAAYRHYASQGELLEAVKTLCQQTLADSMERAADSVGAGFGTARTGALDGDAAVRRIEAIGKAYIRYAIDNPGLFRTAFTSVPAHDGEGERFDGLSAGEGEAFRAFARLTEALDALVATGRMRPENRQYAEAGAWAPVHGLSLLVLDGPLDGLPPETRDAVVAQVVATTVAGLLR